MILKLTDVKIIQRANFVNKTVTEKEIKIIVKEMKEL